MKNNNTKLLAKEWIKKSQDDEASIKAIIKEKGAPTTACFLSQQLVEKCLKGLLAFYNQDIPKIHDLIKLEDLLIKSIPELRKYHKYFVLLNSYYIETRYPGDFPEGFSWSMAKEAFDSALKIKKLTTEKII